MLFFFFFLAIAGNMKKGRDRERERGGENNKSNSELGWGVAECDIGVHFSCAASYSVHVPVVNLKTSALPHSKSKNRNILGKTKFRPNVLYHQS